ncbi:MAG: cysteine desulfurase family protein [Pikeienuella sp.]
MIGLAGRRIYLDWNATAPLRPEARAAMLEAIDAVGNPSSVHAEGRASRAIVERARGQVARLVGCAPEQVLFNSGATEGANHAFFLMKTVFFADVEHDCVRRQVADLGLNSFTKFRGTEFLEVGRDGIVQVLRTPALQEGHVIGSLARQAANSETGVMQPPAEPRINLVDAVQAVGKVPWAYKAEEMDYALISGHKFGGPKGVGALLHPANEALDANMSGGGQERGQRSGTENVLAIAGFGAAAEAAQRDLEAGVWARVEKLRNILEDALAAAAPETIFFGQESPRVPNTSCFAVPGWKGETQVMQMDLAGFAVSSGSACSSGKMRESRVLRAMGFDAETAGSALRVSMGPTTTEAEVLAFANAWTQAYRKRRARAA